VTSGDLEAETPMAVFAVHYTYRSAQNADRDLYRPAHRGYLRELLAEGKVLATGSYVDDENPGALLIFRADSAAAVADLLRIDPFMVHGLVAAADIREWAQAMGPWA
jgi:uncharacterized protein YciI